MFNLAHPGSIELASLYLDDSDDVEYCTILYIFELCYVEKIWKQVLRILGASCCHFQCGA